MILETRKIGKSHSINILVLGKKELSKFETVDGVIENESIPEIVSAYTYIPPNNIYYLNQVHGTEVHKAPYKVYHIKNGDGLYTFQKEIGLVIKTADCIPLFFYSESSLLAGVIHSGWKGTLNKITTKTIDHLIEEYSIKDLRFFLGPSIKIQNYEIGDDVAKHFRKEYPESLIPKKDKFLFGNDIVIKKDLSKYPYFIEDCNICNFENPEFYSHRGKNKGRNLNIIWID